MSDPIIDNGRPDEDSTLQQISINLVNDRFNSFKKYSIFQHKVKICENLKKRLLEKRSQAKIYNRKVKMMELKTKKMERNLSRLDKGIERLITAELSLKSEIITHEAMTRELNQKFKYLNDLMMNEVDKQKKEYAKLPTIQEIENFKYITEKLKLQTARKKLELRTVKQLEKNVHNDLISSIAQCVVAKKDSQDLETELRELRKKHSKLIPKLTTVNLDETPVANTSFNSDKFTVNKYSNTTDKFVINKYSSLLPSVYLKNVDREMEAFNEMFPPTPELEIEPTFDLSNVEQSMDLDMTVSMVSSSESEVPPSHSLDKNDKSLINVEEVSKVTSPNRETAACNEIIGNTSNAVIDQENLTSEICSSNGSIEKMYEKSPEPVEDNYMAASNVDSSLNITPLSGNMNTTVGFPFCFFGNNDENTTRPLQLFDFGNNNENANDTVNSIFNLF